jgi:hypothetical protein
MVRQTHFCRETRGLVHFCFELNQRISLYINGLQRLMTFVNLSSGFRLTAP